MKRSNLRIFGFVYAVTSLFGYQLALAQTGGTPPAVPPVTDTACSNITTYPNEVQPWVQTQCTVDETLFGDEWAASSAYYVEGDVQTGGGVTLKTYDHREAHLSVVYAQEVKMPGAEATPNIEALRPTFVVGRMKGSVGSLPVFGVAFNEAGRGLADQTVFSVISITDEETLEAYTTMVRVLAAEVRVLSLTSLQSKPLSQTSLTAGELMVSDADPSQLLTLTANLGNAPAAGSEPDPECIKRAYEDYAIDMQQAKDNLNTCVMGVMALWTAMVAICVAPAVFPLIGWGLSLGCLAAAMAEQVIGLGICTSMNANEVKAANARLKLALSRCGVNIYES